MSTIHPWNENGLLSPIADPAGNPLARNRAPYLITPVQLVERFGHTHARRKILRGFFGYRDALRSLAITTGFQWVDGSFVEDIEKLEQGRPPGDIDIVTFYQLPDGVTQKSILAAAPEFFPETPEEKQILKDRFSVDTMMSSLQASPQKLIKHTVFFYSVWSHRRDFTWKGFVQVDLDGANDGAAITKIDEMDAHEVARILEQPNAI